MVVDGASLNPGGLSWEPLSACGVYNVHPHSTPAETLARCRDAEAVLASKAEFGRDSIVALPKLKCIGVTATGCNIVDVAAAVERGIVVTNVPTCGTASVAQMLFALPLELTQPSAIIPPPCVRDAGRNATVSVTGTIPWWN